MWHMNGRLALMAAAAGFVLALACDPGSAQDTPVTLRFSHWSPPQHPMSQIAVPEWVNAIEKASGGSIKIQVFPSQQLGKAIDHYDMARDGVADITWVNAGLQPGRFPLAQALEMPWLYSDPAGATMQESLEAVAIGANSNLSLTEARPLDRISSIDIVLEQTFRAPTTC